MAAERVSYGSIESTDDLITELTEERDPYAEIPPTHRTLLLRVYNNYSKELAPVIDGLTAIQSIAIINELTELYRQVFPSSQLVLSVEFDTFAAGIDKSALSLLDDISAEAVKDRWQQMARVLNDHYSLDILLAILSRGIDYSSRSGSQDNGRSIHPLSMSQTREIIDENAHLWPEHKEFLMQLYGTDWSDILEEMTVAQSRALIERLSKLCGLIPVIHPERLKRFAQGMSDQVSADSELGMLRDFTLIQSRQLVIEYLRSNFSERRLIEEFRLVISQLGGNTEDLKAAELDDTQESAIISVRRWGTTLDISTSHQDTIIARLDTDTVTDLSAEFDSILPTLKEQMRLLGSMEDEELRLNSVELATLNQFLGIGYNQPRSGYAISRVLENDYDEMKTTYVEVIKSIFKKFQRATEMTRAATSQEK